MEVAKIFEKERKGGAEGSRTFALELAYIMENFGDNSEEEARLILDMYLKGARNLMLAVSFALRARDHSSTLWEILISHCLSDEKVGSPRKKVSSSKGVDGSLFGSLLEAAALSGADLAFLVKKIPPGMAIEGLRPRLVAAVADYRLKLQMRQCSKEIANSEKIALLREVAHRSRRGVRLDKLENNPTYRYLAQQKKNFPPAGPVGEGEDDLSSGNVLDPSQRTIRRHGQCKHAYSLPLR